MLFCLLQSLTRLHHQDLKIPRLFPSTVSQSLLNQLTPDAPKTILDYYMDQLVPKGVDPDDLTSSTSSTSKRKRDDNESDSNSDVPDDAEFHFEDISDTMKQKEKNGKDVGGRPKDEMMEKLTVKTWKTYSSGILPKVQGYRCATPGCREFHATRNKERVAKHVLRDCIRATDEMRQLVSVYFQSMAPSNQLKEMEERMVTKTMATGSEVRAVKTLRLGTKGSGNTNGLENDMETAQEPNLWKECMSNPLEKARGKEQDDGFETRHTVLRWRTAIKPGCTVVLG